MSRYVRGQVCGVDNCPSRLWKRVDGRNVCQYGHINEFDIEINDDDEMMNNAGGGVGGGSIGGNMDFSRRLVNVTGLTTSLSIKNKLSRLSNDKISTRKYGEDFKKLQSRCFQIILAKNTQFLIKEFKLNQDESNYYISIVKKIWIKLLNNSINRKLDGKNKRYDIGQVILINYLAIIEMNLPISLIDFISLTYNKKFNIERCEYCLPRDLRIQIPISQLKTFHGYITNNYFQLIIKKKFYKQYIYENINDSELNYYPILIKILLLLYLPLDIGKLVKNYIDKYNITFRFKEMFENDYFIHPELKLMGLIIHLSKVYFTNNLEIYKNWWFQYKKIKIKTKSLENGLIGFRKKIFNKSSFHSLWNWNENEIAQFADLYEEHILPNINASNISSNNEYKDRNELQIVNSLKEIFSSRDDYPTQEEISKQDDENTAMYLRQIYSTIIKNDTNNSINEDPPDGAVENAVIGECTVLYQCNIKDIERAVKKLVSAIKQ
jgi:RNA polymerase I-specific transcription initiation factor RRN7